MRWVRDGRSAPGWPALDIPYSRESRIPESRGRAAEASNFTSSRSEPRSRRRGGRDSRASRSAATPRPGGEDGGQVCHPERPRLPAATVRRRGPGRVRLAGEPGSRPPPPPPPGSIGTHRRAVRDGGAGRRAGDSGGTLEGELVRHRGRRAVHPRVLTSPSQDHYSPAP